MREIQKRRAVIVVMLIVLCMMFFGAGYALGQQREIVCPEVEFIYECPETRVIDCDDPCPECPPPPEVRIPVYIHPANFNFSGGGCREYDTEPPKVCCGDDCYALPSWVDVSEDPMEVVPPPTPEPVLSPQTYLFDLGVGIHQRGLWSTFAWNPKGSRFRPVALLVYDTDPPDFDYDPYVFTTSRATCRYGCGQDVNLDVDVYTAPSLELDGWDRWRVGMGAVIGLGPRR